MYSNYVMQINNFISKKGLILSMAKFRIFEMALKKHKVHMSEADDWADDDDVVADRLGGPDWNKIHHLVVEANQLGKESPLRIFWSWSMRSEGELACIRTNYIIIVPAFTTWDGFGSVMSCCFNSSKCLLNSTCSSNKLASVTASFWFP